MLPIVENDAHFDRNRLGRVSALLDQAARDGVFPGAVAGVAHRGRIVYLHAAGRQQDAPEAKPEMPVDAVFDLASVTKPVSGTALLLCLEDGLLSLDDHVARYIPEFAVGDKAAIRIRHLVSHTSGIQSNPKLYHEHKSWETLLPAYLALPLAGPPGSLHLYSSINFIVIALIVERVSGTTLDKLLAERIFAPLGMRDTMFNPPPALRPRIPATEFIDWRGEYDWGVVNDKTAQMMGGVSAHAGLFSTAADLLLFGTMLLGGGTHAGVRVLSRFSTRLLLTPWTDERGARRGVCWLPGAAKVFGDLLAGQCVGHTGTTGTAMCLAPSEEMAIVLLSNRVHPSRDNDRIEALRPRVFNAIAAALNP